MSQVDGYTIPGSPLTMAELATRLKSLFGAAVAVNRGPSAPANAQPGWLWWDTSLAPIEQLRVLRAAGWRTLLRLNVNTGALEFGSKIEVSQGGTGATTVADARQVLGVPYASGFVNLGNQFGSGQLQFRAVGPSCFALATGMSHASLANVSSDPIPAQWRPTHTARAMFQVGTTIYTGTLSAAGVLNVIYRDTDGVATARTGSPGDLTFSYMLASYF